MIFAVVLAIVIGWPSSPGGQALRQRRIPSPALPAREYSLDNHGRMPFVIVASSSMAAEREVCAWLRREGVDFCDSACTGSCGYYVRADRASRIQSKLRRSWKRSLNVSLVPTAEVVAEIREELRPMSWVDICTVHAAPGGVRRVLQRILSRRPDLRVIQRGETSVVQANHRARASLKRWLLADPSLSGMRPLY